MSPRREQTPSASRLSVQLAAPRGGSGVVGVLLTGEVDIDSVRQVDRFLRRNFGPFFFRRPVLLDLAQVTFVDSSFVSYVLRLCTRVRDAGFELVLTQPRGQVRRAIALVGLANVVPVYESLEEGLGLLAAGLVPIIPPVFAERVDPQS